MSKILAASCTGEVVTCEGVPIPTAVILGEGVGASTGILVLDEDTAFYIPKTSPDLKTTLEKVIDALGQAKIGLDKAVEAFTQTSVIDTSLGAAFTANSLSPPPTLVTDIAVVVTKTTAITAAGVQIETAKTALETLKEALK